jgi:hypothetical protein
VFTDRAWRTPLAGQRNTYSSRQGKEGRFMLLLLALLILLLALGGGIFISKFLFILLVLAIIVALFSRRTV